MLSISINNPIRFGRITWQQYDKLEVGSPVVFDDPLKIPDLSGNQPIPFRVSEKGWHPNEHKGVYYLKVRSVNVLSHDILEYFAPFKMNDEYLLQAFGEMDYFETMWSVVG